MSSPAHTTAEGGQLNVQASEARPEQEDNARIAPVPALPVPSETAETSAGLALPRAQPPAFSSEAASLAGTDSALPDYTQRTNDPTAPHLPSYAGATRREPTQEERLTSLREFVEEKQHSADYFGGQKGKPEGPPKDPFKIFRWAKAKAEGEGSGAWRRMSVEQQKKWEEHGGDADPDKGEIVKGDIDTYRLL